MDANNYNITFIEPTFKDGQYVFGRPIDYKSTTLYERFADENVQLTHKLTVHQMDDIIVYSKFIYRFQKKDFTRPTDKEFAYRLMDCIKMNYAETQLHIANTFKKQVFFVDLVFQDIVQYGRKIRKVDADIE